MRKRNLKKNTLYTYACNCDGNICWSSSSVCEVTSCDCTFSSMLTNDISFDNTEDNSDTDLSADIKDEAKSSAYSK